jgi:hypothetical protein
MTIRELMAPKKPRDLPWLMEALQAAVELEFFTLPPYLMALWSIENQKHYAAATIREVVYEEMQHMALACNMLTAVGGTPRINRPPAIPEYPRPMPGGVKPDLLVGLSALTRDVVGVFMKIEEPEVVLGFEALDETFPRIGAFYDRVREVFHQVNPRLSVDRQITGPLAPLVVATLKDVDSAIHIIKVQGEGSNLSPADESPEDLSHFYRFQELDKGQKLKYRPDTKDYHWADKFAFPAVYPVAPVPAGGYRYDEVAPEVAALLRLFDRAYTNLLDRLQSAWDGGGQAAFWQAVELMFSLEAPARALMKITIPGTELAYGPNFRYVSDH